MWPWASSTVWWNSTPLCSHWEWGSLARLTHLSAPAIHRHHNSPTAAARNWGNAFPQFLSYSSTWDLPFHNSSPTVAVGNCLSTIPLLQQQLGSGEMPFQLFLCRGVIYSGYPRGNPGYLLLLIPGEQTPGREGFLTLQETSPPPRANPTREEQHSPQELSISAERGEGTAHLHRAPSLPQSRRTPFRAGWPEQWFQSPSITNPPPLTVKRQDSGY